MKEKTKIKRKLSIFHIGFMGIFVALLFSSLYPTISYATSASMTFKTDKKSITKGEKFNVGLYVESDSYVGDFEAYISYDPEVLEFNPEASFIAGGDGLIKITDNNVMEGDNNRKYVINFTALEVGSSDIKIYDKPVIFDFETGQTMSISNSPLTIEIVATKTASNNANLSSLKISPSILEQEFNKDVLEYTATVDSDITKLVINAITEDEKAIVLIEGDTNLMVGNNIITIVVKAESKETKKYKITVNRKEGTTEVIGDNEIEEENKETYIELNTSTFYKENENTYLQYGYRYQVIDLEEGLSIPDGYIKTSIKRDGISIVVYTPENNLDTDYLLLYCRNENGDTGFYQYDRVENTLQRYNQEKNIINSNTQEAVDSDEKDANLSDRVIILLFIVLALGGVLIGASVIFAKKYLNTKK